MQKRFQEKKGAEMEIKIKRVRGDRERDREIERQGESHEWYKIK